MMEAKGGRAGGGGGGFALVGGGATSRLSGGGAGSSSDGSAGSGRRMGSALTLAKRAMALRIVFDASASEFLAAYKARIKNLARALRTRGYIRLHRLVRKPPYRTMWWLFAGNARDPNPSSLNL
jgi:hypothetical protein